MEAGKEGEGRVVWIEAGKNKGKERWMEAGNEGARQREDGGMED